jgi:anaerobic selenocysteine-containing dehydrogenase
MGQTIVRTTCPRDCYDSCGIEILVRDGAISHVRGDPRHPVNRGTLCAKCAVAYNGALRDPAARLTRPLRRVGAKGEGRFVPTTWDEALATVAGRLSGIARTCGPETIVNAHYTGTRSLLARDFPLRFFNHLGATEVVPETICYIAGQIALEQVYGTAFHGFDPRTAKDAACVVVWGANPSATGPHAHMHWLRETGAVVVVDPIRHPTARAADLHLQPFPGSDAALAFGLMHVLRREGMIDRPFIARHTIGWEEIEPLVARMTPACAEAATGVPAADIERAARLYGRGPSLLWMGMGLSRQPTGGNAIRSIALLPAVTGNMGKAGAGFFYINGIDRRGIDPDYLVGARLRTNSPAFLSHMDLASFLEDPRRSQAIVCWNINIAVTNPQQARLRRALVREDLFTVAIDLFQTDTVDYADIVLPAAGFMEFDDLIYSYFHLSVGAQVKAQEPPGEALSNQEIFRRLAAAMGLSEPALHESDANMLSTLLRQTGLGMDFPMLAEKGTVAMTPDPIPQFERLVFPTPSGRIELASDRAASAGLPRTPRPHADARPAPPRLRLLTPAAHWLSSSGFGNDPGVRKRMGPPVITIHPEDAAMRDLSEGGLAVASNENGELVLTVAVSDIVPRGVALSHKARWLKTAPGGANVNLLNGGMKSDMGEGSAVHGTEIELRRAGQPSRRTAKAM